MEKAKHMKTPELIDFVTDQQNTEEKPATSREFEEDNKGPWDPFWEYMLKDSYLDVSKGRSEISLLARSRSEIALYKSRDDDIHWLVERSVPENSTEEEEEEEEGQEEEQGEGVEVRLIEEETSINVRTLPFLVAREVLRQSKESVKKWRAGKGREPLVINLQRAALQAVNRKARIGMSRYRSTFRSYYSVAMPSSGLK